MKIVFMGTPDFAVPSLEAIVKEGYPVTAVVTQPDRPVGRKRVITPPPVKKLAVSYDLKVLQPERVRDEGFLHTISPLKPDLIVVVAFGQILPKTILDLPTFGCINVHASLLPKYRGAAPIQWALINGEKSTGVTTMWMDEGLDTGDIFLQKSLLIEEDWNAEDLFRELSMLGGSLLLETLKHIERGDVVRIPQPEVGASYAPMLKKEDGFIDWNKSAVEIANRVRGLCPWPGTYTIKDGKEIKIWRARAFDDSTIGIPGTYYGEVKGKGFLVSTSKGNLLVEEIQEVGKRRVLATDYLLGHPMAKGDVFADV